MTMRFLADENFDGRIVNGIRRRSPQTELVRVVDVGLSGASDAQILQWAADHDCLVLTHDVSTMGSFAYERVDRGELMPGLIEVSAQLRIQSVIDDLLLLAEASLPKEWDGQVIYLPL
jgi:hypothetical protein